MPFYVVRIGKRPGIYDSWDGPNGAKEQVNGFTGAEHKKFKDLQSARLYYDQDMLGVQSIETESPKAIMWPRKLQGTHFKLKTPTATVKAEPIHKTVISRPTGKCSVDAWSWAKQKPKTMGMCISPRNSDSRSFTSIMPTEFILPEDINTLMKQYYSMLPDTNILYVYTDGSTIGNGTKRAKGGYGVFFSDTDLSNISEPLLNTKISNNTTELSAMISAFKVIQTLDINAVVHLYYDSEYAYNVITGVKKAHSNKELVALGSRLLRECRCSVIFQHVNSHTGATDLHSIGNEIADRLAKRGAKNVTQRT